MPRPSSSLPGSDASHAMTPLFGLAPDGVCRAGPVTSPAVGSYPARPSPRPRSRKTPTRTVSPLPDPSHTTLTLADARATTAIGGLFSVALSVASRRPAVSRHPALRGPDFPPRTSLRAATAWRTSVADYTHLAAARRTASVGIFNENGRTLAQAEGSYAWARRPVGRRVPILHQAVLGTCEVPLPVLLQGP